MPRVRLLHAICHQGLGFGHCFPLLLPQSSWPTAALHRGRHPGPCSRPQPTGLIQRPGPEPHARCALPGEPRALSTNATAEPSSSELRRGRRAASPPLRPGRPLAFPAARARPPSPRTPRLSHRLLWVDVDLESLLLEGLQGDLHGAAAQLGCRACSGCWPLGGVCGLAGPRGCPSSSCTREEGGGGGGLSHSPCGAASPPALAPGRAAASATAASPAISSRRASSRVRRQPLSLQETRGAL